MLGLHVTYGVPCERRTPLGRQHHCEARVQAGSSVAEHSCYTGEVAGSIPRPAYQPRFRAAVSDVKN